MFHFCCLCNQLFSVLIFHGRNNPVYMLCWRSSGICCTIHPVNPQYLKWICTKRCQSGAGPGGCSGAGTCSRCTKISRSLPSPSELRGYFIGVAQLAAVLFWSRGKAWGGVCCAASMLPSHKAEEHLGPARAGSGDFSCPLGTGFLTIGILSLGEPSVLHPLLAQTKPNREGAACDAPFAGKAWEWHLDLIILLASVLVWILTALAELAAYFHGTKFSTLLGSQLGDPKSSN